MPAASPNSPAPAASGLSPAWRRCLLLQVPAAVLAVGLLVQCLAWALAGTPLRRHDLDLLAATLDRVRADSPAVLLGDSVTQAVLKTHDLGGAPRVANLTTNKASGIVGALFLLRRYLERNDPPRCILVACTPEFLGFTPDGQAARTYLTTVFTRPEEVEWLRRHAPDLVPGWRPAAFAMDLAVGYRLAGLLAPGIRGFVSGPLAPDPALAPEPAPTTDAALADVRQRASLPLAVDPAAAQALRDMGDLARSRGCALTVLVAPVADSVREAWERDGRLAAYLGQVSALLGAEVDAESSRGFPEHAFRDADHLRSPGWTNRYALLLDRALARCLAGPGRP